MKSRIRTGDEVQVVRGTQTGRRTAPGEGESDKNPVGERGRVRKVLRAEGRVIVDRIHMQKKAVRPNPRKGHRGGFIEREAAIPISSVMLVCKKCDRPVRAGVKVVREEKTVKDEKVVKEKRVRVCRRCGEKI